MGMDLTSARRLNRALLSIYYFGRKHLEPFAGAPPPPGLLPVDAAVAELESAGSEGLSSVRLALTDLARTRETLKSSRTDEKVEGLITRLATTYVNLLPRRPNASDFAQKIAQLSRRIPATRGDTPFTRVFNALLDEERGPGSPGAPTPRLVSYEVRRFG
jgi:hypothetical protein